MIEDSCIGTKAALAAGMKCVVTKSSYTQKEDFTGANKIIDELGDGSNAVAFSELEKIAMS